MQNHEYKGLTMGLEHPWNFALMSGAGPISYRYGEPLYHYFPHFTDEKKGDMPKVTLLIHGMVRISNQISLVLKSMCLTTTQCHLLIQPGFLFSS